MWSEAKIARTLVRDVFKGRVLCVPNTSWTGHECDLLVVTHDLRVVDVEIKISRGDLKADAGKEKWVERRPYQQYGCDALTHREVLCGPPAPDLRRDWPRKVWKHYYALPADVWRDDLIDRLPSPMSGVLLLTQRDGIVGVKVHRRAEPCRNADRLTAEQAVDIARLAGLRMWDALCRVESAESALRRAA